MPSKKVNFFSYKINRKMVINFSSQGFLKIPVLQNKTCQRIKRKTKYFNVSHNPQVNEDKYN